MSSKATMSTNSTRNRVSRAISFSFRAGLFLLVCHTVFADSVEVEGKAAGSTSAARAEALADALREAVRTGAGVELVSQSQTTDFALDFDRVFAKARGYIRSYKVLSSQLGADGIYRVKIHAEVARGNPEMEDRLALQQLARLKQMPRVAVRIEENIKGATSRGMASDWIQNTAREIGLQVVDLGKTQGVDNALAKRAAILGRDKDASFRKEGIMDSTDYLIEGTVVGDSLGTQSLYGSLPKQRFSLAVSLKVIDAATGNVVVVENLPARDLLIGGVDSVDVAAREAIRNVLDGQANDKRTDAGWKLFRRLFAHWTTELDLGSTVRMDLTQANLETANKLRESLSREPQIGAVWIRSVDAAGITVFDVESRLDTTTLALKVEQVMSGTFHLDRSGARYLSFISQSSPSATPIQAKSPPLERTPVVSLRMTIIIATAVGLAAALMAAITMLRKKNFS
jgi:hypothetical protein